VGCREGDSVEIYLTYDEAYGKHYVGMVPAKSAVVWFIDIVDVK
jgi:FKBP-type peptidyl-prolyl cis-trans isomerase